MTERETVDYDYLTSIEADGRALVGMAADFDLDLPIAVSYTHLTLPTTPYV